MDLHVAGYALRQKDGYYIGIWNTREVAENLLTRFKTATIVELYEDKKNPDTE